MGAEVVPRPSFIRFIRKPLMKSAIRLKKIVAVVCLQIICSAILNTLPIAQALPQKSIKFIKPIILADYNGGSLYTNLGGLSNR